MFRLKIWLIIIGTALILLNKFSFISKIRDTSAIFIQKQVSLLKYKITNYPDMILLRHTEQKNLETENILLKKQVLQYSLMLKQQDNLTKDSSALKSLDKQDGMYHSFKVEPVRAIVDINYLVNDKLLVDKGSNNGVVIGDAVVNKEGVVGQIVNVYPNSAQLKLITNPDFKIYLQDSVTKSKMLAQGIGNNQLIVKYINKAEKITPGSILVTTGLDDIYPANLAVAKVIKVFYENNGFNTALCQPVVNFDKLQYLLVLNNAN